MSIGIGAKLRDAREEQGRSLEDVALGLRARVSQLDALEEERFEDFGGDVYAKGFLRSYAMDLGLDPEPLLDVYRREVGGEVGAAPPVPISVGAPNRRRPTPPAWMAWVLVAVVVVAGVALLGTLDSGRTPDQASPSEFDGPPPPPAVDTDDEAADGGEDPADDGSAPEQADGGDDDPDAADEPDPADDEREDESEPESESESESESEPEGVDLMLALEADSWLRVIVDGTLVLEQTVAAGETLPFEGEQEIEVRFGNAGGVRANLNGEDLGSQGSSGEAVTLRYTPEGLETA